MESFKYVQFSFTSSANYFAYNKLPLPIPSLKSKISVPDEERQLDSLVVDDEEQPKGVEVFDSSNFDTFKEPLLNIDNQGSNDENDTFMLAFKKAQPENRHSKAVSVTGPGPRDDFKKFFEMSDGNKDSKAVKLDEFDESAKSKNLFDFDQDYVVDPTTILTNAHRFSGPPTPTLPFVRNSLKESQAKPHVDSSIKFEHQLPGPIANSKRVSFSQFDDYLKNGLTPPRLNIDNQIANPEVVEETIPRTIVKSRHSFTQAPPLASIPEIVQRPSLAYAKEENSQLKIQMAILENEKNILIAQLDETRLRLEKSENTVEQYGNQVLKSDDTELIEAKKIIVRLQGQIIKQNSQIAELQKKGGQFSYPSSPKSADIQNSTINNLQVTISKLQSELSNSKNAHANFQQRIEKLETENRKLKTNIPNTEMFNSLGPTGNKITIDKAYLDVLIEKIHEL